MKISNGEIIATETLGSHWIENVLFVIKPTCRAISFDVRNALMSNLVSTSVDFINVNFFNGTLTNKERLNQISCEEKYNEKRMKDSNIKWSTKS